MSFIANNIRHKIGWYYEQARDTSANIEIELLQQAGLEGDTALADYDDFGALLASSNDRCNFTNYTLKTLSVPTVTVQDSNDRVLLGGAAAGTQLTITWATAGGAVNNAVGKVVFLYVPVPGTSTDSQKLVLSGHDVSTTTDGTDLVLTVNVDGLVRVRNP